MSSVRSTQSQAPDTTPAINRWNVALDLLGDDFNQSFRLSTTPKDDIVQLILQDAEARRKECFRKQWRFRRANGSTISIRDILGKIAGYVNRYKDVVTIAVQYDPVHAALPWAAVRFLLNIIVGDVQMWGSLLADLETISQIIFRCAVYEEVYLCDHSETTVALEKHLIDLYKEILRVLNENIKYFGKNTAARTVTSIFQANENPRRMDVIDSLESNFMMLANVHKAKMADQDSKRANKSLTNLDDQLKQVLDTTSQLRLKLQEEKLSSLIQWLSAIPVESHHRAVTERRIPFFGLWLLNHDDFKEWRSSRASACLLVEGNPGSGKSTILSAVVDELAACPQQSSSTLWAFFYCHSSSFGEKRTSPSHIMRSIVRQLGVGVGDRLVSQLILDTYDTIVHECKMRRIDLDELSIAECVDILLDLTAGKTAYIAVDALDELCAESRAIVLEALRNLATESTGCIKLFYTSRLNSHVRSLLQGWATILPIDTKNYSDVERFIDMEMNQAIKHKRILNGNAPMDLLQRIRFSLRQGADELFLWPKLQLDFLCDKKTESDMSAALDRGLNGGLDQIYGLILDSILHMDPIAKRIAKAVLSWLLFAEQPLHAKVLPSILSWVLQDDIDDTTIDVFDVCHHLVVVDTQSAIVRFCHASAQEFLRSSERYSEYRDCQILSEICFKQCIAGPSHFSPNLNATPISDLYQYAAVHWPTHARQSMDVVTNDLYSHAMMDFIFGGETESESFAFKIWLRWLQKGLQSLPDYHHLRGRLELVVDTDMSPILIACAFGIPILFERALRMRPSLDLEHKGIIDRTILWLACSYGNTNIVPRLLGLGANKDAVCGEHGSPLIAACFRGHNTIVNMLLDHGSNSEPSEKHLNLYNAACKGGQEQTALILVQRTGFISSDAEYKLVFAQAIRSGFTKVVAWLQRSSFSSIYANAYTTMLDSNADFLSSAIKQGNIPLLQTLMREGPESSRIIPLDAMAIASLAGRIKMMKFLHQNYVMSLEHEGVFGSPLRSASLMGHTKTVRLLLDLGANPRSLGSKGSALQAASQKGYIPIMKMLIEAGAEINTMSAPFDTSLRAASYHGNIDAVKFLLANGAIISRPGEPADAIAAAVERGHTEIAALLAEKGNFCSTPNRISRPHYISYGGSSFSGRSGGKPNVVIYNGGGSSTGNTSTSASNTGYYQ